MLKQLIAILCCIHFISLYNFPTFAADDEEASFFKIDPAGTYFTTDDLDYELTGCLECKKWPLAASYIDLSPAYTDPNVLLRAGDFLLIQGLGDFKGGDSVDVPGPATISAVFVNSGGGFLSPGPDGNATSIVTGPTLGRGWSTDIPQDFLVPQGVFAKVQVPAGATRVLLSVVDGNYANNTDPNGALGVFATIEHSNSMKLSRTIYRKSTGFGGNIPEKNNAAVEMVPSVFHGYECLNENLSNSERIIVLKCLDYKDSPVDNCKVSFKMNLGNDNGGHNHGGADRPLGDIYNAKGVKLTPNTKYTIPATGVTWTYRASDVAGEIKLHFDAVDPSGNNLKEKSTKFTVKTTGFQKLSVPELTILVASHPDVGDYGLPMFNDSLNHLIDTYIDKALESELSPDEVLSLKSEAGTMKWGGLFDIDKDWEAPHCGHRDGRTLDISRSVFNNSPNKKILEKALSEALIDRGFDVYKVESPKNPSANHFHIHW